MRIVIITILCILFSINCLLFWDFQEGRLNSTLQRLTVFADSLIGVVLPPPPPEPKLLHAPDSLSLTGSETVSAGIGVKSVLFDANGAFLYALNLEDMSIMEYERDSRMKTRTLKFAKTAAKGYDYQRQRWINSYEEKPVEGCLTHNGRFLWISLHNAGGVVVWDLEQKSAVKALNGQKQATIIHHDGKKEEVLLPFIATGKTPKVIVADPENRYLFVSNWHDNNLAVIDIAGQKPSAWYLMKHIPTGVVPRGLTFLPQKKQLVVANMGGGTLSTIDFRSMRTISKKKVGPTPRHLLANRQYLYASLSSGEQLVKIDQDSLVRRRAVTTAEDPRTICFSPDSSMVFVTCYSSNRIQAYSADSLKLLGSWKSDGKPVGIDVWQDGQHLEAWACNYSGGTIKILKLKAHYGKRPELLAKVAP